MVSSWDGFLQGFNREGETERRREGERVREREKERRQR
jgi:hypothetical protein